MYFISSFFAFYPAGFVGCVSETFTEHMFWAVISVVGQTWHRMVRPYTLPPWNLARLVAYEEPLESKQACV